MRGMKSFFCITLLSLLLLGCAGTTPLSTSQPVPAANAGFDTIWAYAASLEDGVVVYARRHFRNYPEGLRQAVSRHRVDFLASGTVPGTVPELQSYLFFEFRRQRGLAGNDQPGAPDPTTARYVRALIQAIREGT